MFSPLANTHLLLLLTGKPMAVQQHADIIAVSYEARALGVKKHMPVASIRREHPSVRLVHVEVSNRTSAYSVTTLHTCSHLSVFLER